MPDAPHGFTLHKRTRDGFETWRAPTPRAYGLRKFVTVSGGVHVTGYATTIDGERFDGKGGGAQFRLHNESVAKLPARFRPASRVVS